MKPELSQEQKNAVNGHQERGTGRSHWRCWNAMPLLQGHGHGWRPWRLHRSGGRLHWPGS